MQRKSEVLVTIEVVQSEIVTRVVERIGGDDVFLGEGRAAVNEAMKPAIIQSLSKAEQNARVSIRVVSVQDDGKVDLEQIRQILRSIHVRERNRT